MSKRSRNKRSNNSSETQAEHAAIMANAHDGFKISLELA